jgi:ABC-type Zn2+ transport system substrate-binding protein/surface adhesin
MTEKTKEEELKQKLLDFFDKKLTDLTTKFQTDIDSIEKMKYEYFDLVIKKYEEIEEEHKKHQAEEKEKHDKEKEKPEKKSEETKHEKYQKRKSTQTRGQKHLWHLQKSQD